MEIMEMEGMRPGIVVDKREFVTMFCYHGTYLLPKTGGRYHRYAPCPENRTALFPRAIFEE